MRNYASPAEALSDMKERGYQADFETTSFCLYCGDLDIRLDPDDFHIDETCRFGGHDTNDGSIVYAITSSTGVKGTLKAAFADAENGNSAMACKLNSHQADFDSLTVRT